MTKPINRNLVTPGRAKRGKRHVYTTTHQMARTLASHGFPMETFPQFAHILTEAIAAELAAGRRVTLMGFGTFYTKVRTGRTITTSYRTYIHPTAHYVRFKPSPSLANLIKSVSIIK